MINPEDPTNKHRLAVASMAKIARAIYRDAPLAIRHKQALRPYICPLQALAEYVPREAAVLDVGCGAGLFILTLASLGRIRSAVGFDVDAAAITAARELAHKMPISEQIRFEHWDARDPWPDGRYDVVSMIDVMHHVPPGRQADLIATAAEHVAPGGLLLYKDMADRPLWRAWANRLHDLLSAGEWIHYVKLDEIANLAHASGLEVKQKGAMNMLWYAHEWLVATRPAGASSR